jgi:hypothetical protein
VIRRNDHLTAIRRRERAPSTTSKAPIASRSRPSADIRSSPKPDADARPDAGVWVWDPNEAFGAPRRGRFGQQKICGRCLRTLADGYCGFAGYPTTTNGAHSRGSASASDFAASVIASIALAECIALISRAEMKSCSSDPCRWRRCLVRLIPVALCALHAKHPFFPRGELFLNFLNPNARAPHRFHVNVTRRDFRSDLPT